MSLLEYNYSANVMLMFVVVGTWGSYSAPEALGCANFNVMASTVHFIDVTKHICTGKRKKEKKKERLIDRTFTAT